MASAKAGPEPILVLRATALRAAEAIYKRRIAEIANELSAKAQQHLGKRRSASTRFEWAHDETPRGTTVTLKVFAV
jgi:hypothetical protein